jgi:hypothetical protein
MHDLFELTAPMAPSRETMAEGAMLLRGAALPLESGLLAAPDRHHRDIPVPAYDHSWRLHDVRRHDQLRRSRMDY